MARSTPSHYWQGFRGGAPFVLVIAPFAMLFGVVATEAGLSVAQTMGFSVLVIAGAAQFTAVQMMLDDAPTLIILATSLAVNLRMAMYSAALTPHLGEASIWKRATVAYFLVDQSYTVTALDFESGPKRNLNEKLRFFAGVMSPIAPVWYAMTLFGALVGGRIPPEYALDFAVPITFISMIAPAIRSLAHLAAVLVSITVALALAFLPYSLGLLIAAILAMIAGAQVEVLMKRRAKWN